MNVTTNQTCSIDDLRYTAVVYAGTSVDAFGNPGIGDLCEQFRSSAMDWSADKDPYWCAECDENFSHWESALAHLAVTAERAL